MLHKTHKILSSNAVPDSLSLFFNVVLERGGKSNTPTKQLIVVSQMPQKSKAMCLKCFQKIKLGCFKHKMKNMSTSKTSGPCIVQ